jgi:hypothetical protein
LASDTSFVIIGGQACALWAKQFDQTNLQLRNFHPYVTRDLDLCTTTKRDVSAVASATGGDAKHEDSVQKMIVYPLTSPNRTNA